MVRQALIVISAIALLFVHATFVGAAEPKLPPIKQLPPPGIEIPAAERENLSAKLKQLRSAIDGVAKGKDARAKALLPDVEVYFRAVSDALEFGEFFKPAEFKTAATLLEAGLQRAAQLAAGEAPWTEATGLVVRGYVSRIDGSVQPYGLVVPASYTPRTAGRYRLDIWFHGRGDTLTELAFLNDRGNKVGQFAPADTIVLHPYGRFCNGYKFAGEVDALEALDAVRAAYRVDDERTSVRGFSMGGAATWHMAVHYADRWCAANPGAGFVDTRQYLGLDTSGEPAAPWYVQKLWGLYDCPPLVSNLLQCPLVAYSGELDKQKAAADLMAAAFKNIDVEMTHIIGPKTEHKYEPQAAAEVERRMASLAQIGRRRVPDRVFLETRTLKYPRMNWIEVEGLAEHWAPAHVEAMIVASNSIAITPDGVTDLRIRFGPGECPLPHGIDQPLNLILPGAFDRGQFIKVHAPASDRSFDVRLHRSGQTWTLGARRENGLRKRHNLQGPIDDAFMDAFLFVEPSGTAAHPAVQTWVEAERSRAIKKWRQLFRGHARVKRDTDVTDDDIAKYHLVLWGDAASNELIKRVLPQLPVQWTAERVAVGSQAFDAAGHVVAMIHPNPLNSTRYVVLNSGFTFRDGDNSSNARMTPKLPDWAVIDLSQPPDEYTPGKIVAADFFDEAWRVKKAISR
ncbi:MAG: prolyl oligopeptidase family serine peptidase [Planctomycetes bacterium]|nr:prolyl oligopeptidase family serine peptidase [Planctomycetota bacterium]